jgi:small-conductance mechanosensitive channel
MSVLLTDTSWRWCAVLIAVVGSASAGLLVTSAVLALARGFRPAARTPDGDLFLATARVPLRILLASIFFRQSARWIALPASAAEMIAQATFTLVVFTAVWFVLRALRAVVAWASERLPDEPEREIRDRVLRTRLTLLRQMVTALIVAVAIAVVLMQFELVRHVGLSLLASAGLIGIVFGFAAQKPLAALMAGIQLSLTQPIRIGDAVFIEKELGTVEKIYLTYVVVRLREQRMLVIPVSRFLDTPFENWTLAAPDVIGTVLLSVDFTAPVDAIRVALAQACAAHEAWDRKTCSLEVTDATEHAMTLRALVSSSDAAKNWALRCFVRERLIAFVAGLDQGSHLPRDRAGGPSVPTLLG